MEMSLQPAAKTESNFVMFLSSKIFKILNEAIPEAFEVVPESGIYLFIEFMRQKVDLLIEEGAIALVLLQRFITKQSAKGINILNTRNIGMMLVVLFILSMKLCRDFVHKNSFFSEIFAIPIASLNRSESGFLRVLDHDLWVQDTQFLLIFDELSKFNETKITV
ncbi:MAG: hypothetical protein EZS28_019995 [Streblomastix strix]|uniref:Cyclin N-terminal domain-containing protein n=1 Tax=Streblomastix strix TaxID=222440 RepID=A0A5J4VQE0_9EUKA|nr:MAG: hypothetical protein EZS28_019995 [Streblomastix strix]